MKCTGQVPEVEQLVIDEFLVKETDTLFQKVYDGKCKNLKTPYCRKLNSTIIAITQALDAFIFSADVGTVALKTLMCRAKEFGVSPDTPPTYSINPFWTTNPVNGYFGWLNDPILVDVYNLLESKNQSTREWATSVPGIAVNYSTPEETRRRIAPTIQKTGKKHTKEVAQFVRYNNMTTQYVCTQPCLSPNATAYNRTTQFPACPNFNHDWTDEEIAANGYALVFNSTYANRIAGNDASLFGRPVITDKVQIYINDIYRTLYMEREKDVYDWHGIKLHRFHLQKRDLENASLYPPAAQYFNFAPSGMENITKAVTFPAWASNPHFYDGDPRLAAAGNNEATLA